jgi:type IV secretory pathway TrbD component
MESANLTPRDVVLVVGLLGTALALAAWLWTVA